MVTRFFSQPISRLVLISFITVSMLPILVLGYKLYHAAWDNAWREIREKHQLLAENLASPIYHYINDKKQLLGVLSISVSDAIARRANNKELGEMLQHAKPNLHDFDVISFVDVNGRTRALISEYLSDAGQVDLNRVFGETEEYQFVRSSGKFTMSGVVRSKVSTRPTVIMAFPVIDNNQLLGVIMAEMSLDRIEQLRKNIHFGIGGHSAMVDNLGRVAAHPNPDWMREIRDLSHLEIIKKMLNGETGVTEFYSPFVKKSMVAGYTSVPEIGWGIMVPQPKEEVEHQVNTLLINQLLWGFTGILVTLLVAIMLARRITSPINGLAEVVHEVIHNDYQGEIPVFQEGIPQEVADLSFALSNLVTGLQASREKINSMNANLIEQVEQATEELRLANQRLEESARTAEDANQAKSHFLAGMSHEIRTPINAIIGYSEIMVDALKDCGQTDLLDDMNKIRFSSRHLLEVINEVLDLSKVEAGKMDVDLETVDVETIVKEVEVTIEPLAAKQNNLFYTKFGEALGEMNTDRTKVKQVLINIISNACKFTSGGTISLEVNKMASTAQSMIEFIVRDTGIGMTSEQMSRLFEAYSQVSDDAENKQGGTGLGLNLSKKFVELLSGSITVDSTPGVGTTFTVCLPVSSSPVS